MKKFFNLSILLTFLTLVFVQATIQGANVDFLKNRYELENPRYNTMLTILNMLSNRKAKTIVELGSSRDGENNYIGDGGSTIIFGDWASKNHALLYSVDNNELSITNAINATKPYAKHIQFHLSDSVKFLRNFDGIIDLLYIDSVEYDLENPKPAQEAALREVMAAYPSLHSGSFIVIDDNTLPGGGRGKLAVKFLKDHGCKVIYDDYQIILAWE